MKVNEENSFFDLFVAEARTWDWQKLINYGATLSDFDGFQDRFLKAKIIEKAIARMSNGTLKYVHAAHKDYDVIHILMPNKTAELKSLMSTTLYSPKKLDLRKNLKFKFNNSNGNNKEELNPDHIADVVMVLTGDCAVLISKENIMEYKIRQDDGWAVSIPTDKVVKLTERLMVTNSDYRNPLFQTIEDIIDKELDYYWLNH